MARCSQCQCWMIGGIQEGDLRFCSIKCHEDGFICQLVDGVDDAFLHTYIKEIQFQACPVCKGVGPVDLYTKHVATSLVYASWWKDVPRLSCRQCGVRHVWNGLIWTTIFGWWHFPIGIVTTPWQLLNSVNQLRKLTDNNTPSAGLIRSIKLELGQKVKKLAQEKTAWSPQHY